MEKATHTIYSWFFDVLKLYLQYLSVGLSAIPTAFLYFTLIYAGVNNQIALAFSVAAGLIIAVLTWRFIGKHLFQSKTVQPLLSVNIYDIPQRADAAPNFILQFPRMSTTATASLVVVAFGSLSPNQTITIQPQSNINAQQAVAPTYKVAITEV